MKNLDPKITNELLIKWNACDDGILKFNELFPDGAYLEHALDILSVNYDDYAFWLFRKCRALKLYNEITSKGYRNSGYRNSGDYNSGDYNSGNNNSGYRNSGYRNSGYRNSGDYNSGNNNSGNNNSGNNNSGNNNSGDRNSGFNNSGDRNSGDYNSGDFNSGFFNTNETTVRLFNKDTGLYRNDIIIPSIELKITQWIDENSMTEEQKINDKSFYVRGGTLIRRTYKEAWALYWSNASKEEKDKFLNLPNFDADIFFEITGIKFN